MIRMTRRSLLACLVVVLCAPVSAQSVRQVRLTILHTNDTHGHLLPYSYPDTFDTDSPLAKLASRHDIGGAARRATLVKQARAEKGHETLLIDSGDVCDGTPFSTEYGGEADVAAMNAIGYDLACPGNHEFSNPIVQVRKLKSLAKFPVLCANLTEKNTDKPLYLPSVIRDIGGVKVAFFGLLTYDTRTYRGAKNDCAMEKPEEVAARIVPELRKQADVVVAVTHIGIEEDRALAEHVSGIDVIVGGHSHTLLDSPVFVASTHPQSGSRRGTVIVQDYQWGGTLGRLDLTLDRLSTGAWVVGEYEGKLLPVTSRVPEDPAVAAVVSTYWDPIKAKYAEVLGQAAGDFAKKGWDYAEYNLMADAIREGLGLDFDLENMFGVRNSLARGPITYGDVVSMDPFGNTVVTFRATGRQLKEMLQKHRPCVSGIRYRWRQGSLEEATIGGKPIEDDRIYSGATNSFMAQTMLRDISDKTDTKKPRLSLLMDYIRKRGTVAPSFDGRRDIDQEVRG